MDAVSTMAPWREAFEAFVEHDSAASMGTKAREAAFGIVLKPLW